MVNVIRNSGTVTFGTGLLALVSQTEALYEYRVIRSELPRISDYDLTADSSLTE